MQTFDIYFLGEILPDSDPAEVRRGVAGLFKIQEDAAERLFSGQAYRVKQAQDAETASRYRAAFRAIGALIQIVPSGAPAPADRVPATPPTAAGSASNQDRAAVAEPAHPDQAPTKGDSDSDLAAPGSILDDTPPPPPADIDTSGLDALPPNTGTLEDCKVEKPPRPIPDISHMKLVDD